MAEHLADLAAEKAVLGASFVSPNALTLARAVVKPAHFAAPAHRHVFGGLCALADGGTPIDRVTLVDHLRTAGTLAAVTASLDLDELDFCGLGAERVEAHAKIVADHAEARGYREAATKLLRTLNAGGAKLAAVREQVGALLAQALEGQSLRGPKSFADLAIDYCARVEAVLARGPGIDGIPTGLADLDTLISGFHPEEFVIVGARPRVGKSALVMQMAVAAAKATGQPVLGFSLEMSAVNLFARTVHGKAGVDAALVRNGMISQEQFSTLQGAMNDLSKLPVWIDDAAGMTVTEMRATAQAMKTRGGLSMVFLDYAQLLESESDKGNRQLDISAMSRALKRMAKDLKVPVVALSQLSRKCEERTDKRPIISDLRESGSLEQDADVVIFLYRDVLHNPKTEKPAEAEIIVAKQRNGPPDTVFATWDGPFTRFCNIEKDDPRDREDGPRPPAYEAPRFERGDAYEGDDDGYR